jgi:hypothetical protein
VAGSRRTTLLLPPLFEVRIEGHFAERAPAPRGYRGESVILHQYIGRSVIVSI